MKHEYTDTQLRQAVAYFLEDEEADLSVSTLGEFFWTQQVKALRKMLDALPEPATDGWQECRFEDIRKGDRVKRVRIYDSGTTDIREGVIENKDAHFASCTQKRILVSSEDLNSPIVTLYRIPAPVQHPDPKEQLVILVRGAYNVEWSNTYAFVSDGSGYCIVEPTSDSRLLPESITNWEPADIVPKVVEDDR